jgi:glycogen debranching enzyme
LWRGDRFVGIHASSGQDIECESLITSLPIVLGERLPANVIKALAKRIRRCATPHGLATEDPGSELYSDDYHAYWRGSVWAPSTMLVVDGLRRAGEDALARRIARAYCRAAAACGFRENWGPLDGAGRMEVAYTWTSSVYLVLAHEYV